MTIAGSLQRNQSVEPILAHVCSLRYRLLLPNFVTILWEWQPETQLRANGQFQCLRQSAAAARAKNKHAIKHPMHQRTCTLGPYPPGEAEGSRS